MRLWLLSIQPWSSVPLLTFPKQKLPHSRRCSTQWRSALIRLSSHTLAFRERYHTTQCHIRTYMVTEQVRYLGLPLVSSSYSGGITASPMTKWKLMTAHYCRRAS
ncbi:hypothetical protein F5B17DRAFT_418239 [Nemania serpens]|nr:hypothetical protein F5B17DRAFT_418239 [Nemania serpens]